MRLPPCFLNKAMSPVIGIDFVEFQICIKIIIGISIVFVTESEKK